MSKAFNQLNETIKVLCEIVNDHHIAQSDLERLVALGRLRDGERRGWSRDRIAASAGKTTRCLNQWKQDEAEMKVEEAVRDSLGLAERCTPISRLVAATGPGPRSESDLIKVLTDVGLPVAVAREELKKAQRDGFLVKMKHAKDKNRDPLFDQVKQANIIPEPSDRLARQSRFRKVADALQTAEPASPSFVITGLLGPAGRRHMQGILSGENAKNPVILSVVERERESQHDRKFVCDQPNVALVSTLGPGVGAQSADDIAWCTLLRYVDESDRHYVRRSAGSLDETAYRDVEASDLAQIRGQLTTEMERAEAMDGADSGKESYRLVVVMTRLADGRATQTEVRLTNSMVPHHFRLIAYAQKHLMAAIAALFFGLGVGASVTAPWALSPRCVCSSGESTHASEHRGDGVPVYASEHRGDGTPVYASEHRGDGVSVYASEHRGDGVSVYASEHRGDGNPIYASEHRGAGLSIDGFERRNVVPACRPTRGGRSFHYSSVDHVSDRVA